jgi:hypothetical protein
MSIARLMQQAAAGGGGLNIGDAYGGGYYAGTFEQAGQQYYLIVAPKSSGESSSKLWKTSNSGTSGTSSDIDGAANTSAMDNASHPAAQFCAGLTIDGYSDWYMPARYELELCYFNLKPTTANNSTSTGTNTYAVPPRTSNYTVSDPPQTSAANFQSGGSEAFAATAYWTSTQLGTLFAYTRLFDSGSESNNAKATSNYVRAVRREAI